MATQCPKCQFDNASGSKFCKECGTQLAPSEDAYPSFTKTLETPVTRLAIGSIFAERYEVLEKLGPGTWECYEHPGMIIEGGEAAWHIGAEEDAIYRAAVTRALTDDRLAEVIKRRKIKLIGYKDLKSWH